MIILNNGKSVFASIEAIAATSSKLEKEALIKQAGTSSPLFMRSVIYAYDPFKNYGISNAPKKTPGLAPGGNSLEEPVVWKILDELADRTLSGNSARDKVQMMVDLLDEPSSEIFRRIINKDMRAGFTDGTINRVFKGTIAEFPYMRCSLPAKSNMGKWDWNDGIIVQEKADGMFANVNFDGSGYLWITSRQGSPFPAGCLGIETDMTKVLLPGTQTHGELTVFEGGELMPREKGNGVLNSLLSGGSLEADQRVVFEAWDQIPLESVASGGKHERPYRARFTSLVRQAVAAQRSGIVSVRTIPTRIVKSKPEAYAYYRELLKKGKEGVVCKHPSAIWKDTTSKDQVKLKLEVDVELKITGFIAGSPGTKTEATFGSLQCQSECGLLEVGVSGLTDAMRQVIHNERERFLHSVVTVRANAIMSPDGEGDDLHSLFLPRVIEFREDKRVADSLERIREQFEAAVEGA